MAIMHPMDIENYNYTDSEKAFYIALQNQLPDKYHVFYSVRWFEVEDNKRSDSESDFIIFDPSFGYITIEVKGGSSILQHDKDWFLSDKFGGEFSTRKLKCSPYEQAEKSMRHFHKYFFNEFHQSFKGTYGFAVAFPWYSAISIISSSNPKEITIDMNDMDYLQAKINSIFHYWKNKRNLSIPFSEEQRKRFISLINKRISLSAAAGALIPIKEKEFKKINAIQDSILDAVYNYKELRFVGGAGTGKTFMGAKKAIRDYKDGKKTLFTCCNSHLIEFVKLNMFKDFPQIECMTFDSIIRSVLGSQYDQISKYGKEYVDALKTIANYQKYDSIIVDEAQDFDNNMGLLIRELLSSPNASSLYVFYDQNQNLFSQNFVNAFAIEYPPIILRYNIRNTGRIYENAIQKTGLGNDTVANSLLGVEPEYYEYNNKLQALKALTNIVNRLTHQEFVPLKSLVILSNETYEHSILVNEKGVGAFEIDHTKKIGTKKDHDKIQYSTISDFKGLESDVVIYINHITRNEIQSLKRSCELYVALTRARYYLYVLNIIL